VEDSTTGQEYLLTSGGRGVLGVDSEGNVNATTETVSSIASGTPVSKTGTPLRAQQAPRPVGPGGMVKPRGEPGGSMRSEPLMPLEAFIARLKRM